MGETARPQGCKELFEQIRAALEAVVGYLEVVGSSVPSIPPDQRHAYLTAAIVQARQVRFVLNGAGRDSLVPHA